jgi:hypothetical protein
MKTEERELQDLREGLSTLADQMNSDLAEIRAAIVYLQGNVDRRFDPAFGVLNQHMDLLADEIAQMLIYTRGSRHYENAEEPEDDDEGQDEPEDEPQGQRKPAA